MPVNGTPAGNPGNCNNQVPGTKVVPVSSPALPETCMNQHVIVSEDPRDSGTGKPVLTRIRAYKVPGAQKACLRHTMVDVNGAAVNLCVCLGIDCPDTSTTGSTTCDTGSSSSSSSSQPSSSSSSSSESTPSSSSSSEACDTYKIVFRMGEYLTMCHTEYEVTVIDAANGIVEVCFCPDDLNCPGIYFGEFALIDCSPECEDQDDSVVIFSNRVYVHVGLNLWTARASGVSAAGPPSIAEVRLALRDSSPEESYLLDNVAFSDEEIMWAIIRPVQYWNEQPPPIGTHTTNSFPYRYHWLTAIAGELFLIVAEQQRRNNLQYAAAGVSLNDQDKELNYEKAGQLRLQRYYEFVKRKKAEINLSNAYGGLGSTYQYLGRADYAPYRGRSDYY